MKCCLGDEDFERSGESAASAKPACRCRRRLLPISGADHLIRQHLDLEASFTAPSQSCKHHSTSAALDCFFCILDLFGTVRMKLGLLLPALVSAASAKSIATADPPRQHVFSNPPEEHEAWYKIPTVRESAAMARKILHLTTLGTLVTRFPESISSNDIEMQDSRPSDVAGDGVGLMEYYADCDPHSGNPIMLAIDIATPFRNYKQGSNISLSVRWWPERKKTYSLWSSWSAEEEEEIPTPHTPAALPRFSLHGHLEDVTPENRADYDRIQKCFLRSHPDSKYWQPGNEVSHQSHYVQLVVEHIFWFGGFGDRARIEWLPVEEWRNISMKEAFEAKLPGEKSKKSTCGTKWWRNWL